MLNRSKSKAINLNEQRPVGAWPGVTMLPSGTGTSYLGILFGHRLPAKTQIDALEAKFYLCFRAWAFRARTLQGRRLLVQSVVMSTLRYYTEVVPIPPKRLVRWQAMITNFVLGKKTRPGERYMALVKGSVRHDTDVGLAIPHVATMVPLQRLRRLQLLLAHGHDSDQA
ncbi:hypothetical protein ACHHYP_16201 [Achlya hypogyna]|uniref:Uncharacterized protein n=1 Tax=Achlya hypogyna TaxID=1202772 RepID=A0A1V9Y9D6_ACHHY|nr:hypothetical protein ACHHYP_16201 [Achlya hypogyna]